MAHIFLSYSRKDADIMNRVRNAIMNSAFEVYTDEELLPGTESWTDALQVAIEEAGAMVVLLSEDARRSQSIESEIRFAQYQEVRIFPVLAKGDERKAKPIELIGVQLIRNRQNRGDMKKGLASGVETCVEFR